MSKIIVIGANHAGTAAINTILDNYKDKEVVAFDRNSNISFLGCGMALWIGGQIDGPEGLFYSSKEKLEAKGAKIHMETEIIDVDFDRKIVVAKDKTGKTWEESYDKLILATGSVPIKPNIPGADLKNVQFVKLYQNAQEVIEKLEHEDIKNIAVVGAGYIGVELAEAFKRHGKNVELIDLCYSCLTGYYDKPLRDMMEKNLLDHGVGLNFSEKLLEIKGNGKVEEIVTDNKSYRTDMVILAVGFKPNTPLGKGKLDTFKNGAYRVNRAQETSINSVYAVGDCATVYDNSIMDTNYIALATNAVRSAIIAAHNVCGVHIESPGVQGSNGISVFGLNMVSTGLTYEKAEKLGYNAEKVNYKDLQKPEFIVKNNEEVVIEIVYDKISRRLLGAQMASRYDISMGIHMFSLAVQEGITIDKLKLLDIFFLPHFNKPYNYITVAALKAK